MNNITQQTLTPEQIQILQHTLGADSRYKKSQWGFRNQYCTRPDDIELNKLVDMGLMNKGPASKLLGGDCYFWATEAGCKAIGFTKKQIAKAMEE